MQAVAKSMNKWNKNEFWETRGQRRGVSRCGREGLSRGRGRSELTISNALQMNARVVDHVKRAATEVNPV